DSSHIRNPMISECVNCVKPYVILKRPINGVFAALIAGVLIFTQNSITKDFLLDIIFYIIITPVISVTLTRIMFQSENAMIVDDALQRIDSVLNLKPLAESNHPEHPRDASVRLNQVHFSYDGENEAIAGISLTIPSGQKVAFVGPSGGGKTTLANLICRFFDPQSGSVEIGGVNVKNISKEELMNTVSFVFQNSRLIKASILENVRMAKPDATRKEIMAALHQAQCDDILEKLPKGADTVIGTKGVYLSGGEQQRIAIARVMLKNSPVIILDEATAFADPDNETRVQTAFSKLSEGKTVIMIAHRLSTVTDADQIYVIENGRVAESGKSQELLKQGGIFSRMYQDYQTSVQWKVAKEVQ
uniref:ABC transporter ATP-binding protein n=1 Tax=Faecalicoccus acidiformans TaxID=915173 RepID=UPI002356D8A4